MDKAYTSGPWFCGEKSPHNGNYYIGPACYTGLDSVSPYVAIVTDSCHSVSDEAAEANAALIASAPELYEALNKLREVVGEQLDWRSLRASEEVDSALAHAENRELGMTEEAQA
jgi:hypothetical protein